MDYSHLSRVISHALRHAPWLYELELDDTGWTAVDALLPALRSHSRRWRNVSEHDLARMIERSDKRRYEMRDSKIRALYGHSLPKKLLKERAVPPQVLYHGTAPDTAQIIRGDGLRPMRRQYIHLSVDVQTARAVGGRKAGDPVILKVLAAKAHEAGVAFYRGNDMVWLADQVPPKFIQTL